MRWAHRCWLTINWLCTGPRHTWELGGNLIQRETTVRTKCKIICRWIKSWIKRSTWGCENRTWTGSIPWSCWCHFQRGCYSWTCSAPPWQTCHTSYIHNKSLKSVLWAVSATSEVNHLIWLKFSCHQGLFKALNILSFVKFELRKHRFHKCQEQN